MAAEMFTFDGTINLGQIAEIVVLGLAMLGYALRMVGSNFKVRTDIAETRKEMKAVSERLAGVDTELKKQTDILVRLGAQDARLTNLEKQIGLLNERILLGVAHNA
jgi:hypothetical protein